MRPLHLHATIFLIGEQYHVEKLHYMLITLKRSKQIK